MSEITWKTFIISKMIHKIFRFGPHAKLSLISESKIQNVGPRFILSFALHTSLSLLSLLFPPEFWQEQIALPHIYRLVWIRQCFPDICERRWLRCNFSCEHIFCGHSCPLYCDLFVKKGRWRGEHSVINDFCRDVSAEIGQAEMREPQITLKEKWDRAGVWCSRSWFDEISQKLFSSGVVLEI